MSGVGLTWRAAQDSWTGAIGAAVPAGAEDHAAVVARMKDLAPEYRRYGCPRLHAMLRREGLVVNHKRTYRLYIEQGP